MLTTAGLVFASTFLADLAWGVYVRSIAQHKPHTAGLYSVLIVVFGSVATINYVENKWMLVPAALGAYAGTLTSFIFKKRTAT